jgi:hypothetical protein
MRSEYALSNLRGSNVILVSFNQALVRPLGCISLLVHIRGKSLTMVYNVVEECANILISYRDAVCATLIPHTTCGECSEPAIEALSTYRGKVIHLNLTDDATPKNFPPRKVPMAMESEVKAELKRMTDEGVIVEEREPTEWCSPMIVRRKPTGLLRVCMDPRYLNAFLKRATYPLPDVESVFPKFRSAKFFSKLDFTAGFWQVLLDLESSKLCTFSTPFGPYRYLHLPFLISPAPEVFHRIVADVIHDLPGVMHFVDDILVWGESQDEHDKRLKAKLGLNFNPTKCEFEKREVLFLEHVVDGVRVRPNPAKTAAVIKFPTPQSVEDV